MQATTTGTAPHRSEHTARRTTTTYICEAYEAAQRKLTWIRERTGEDYDAEYFHQLVLEALREQELRVIYNG